MRFLWFCTGLFAMLAVVVLVAGLLFAKGAPQEASVAAIALCVAAIPYVFTRAFEGWATSAWRREVLAELKRQSGDINRLPVH